MKNSRSILYILLTAFGLILIYNYIIVPLLISSNYRGMGMGMHMGMQNQEYYGINYYAMFQLILLIGGIIVAGLLLIGILKADNKCKKCGYTIKDENWKVCPKCGNRINRKG